MARKKSKLRSMMSARRLRWSATRALAACAPSLGRSLAFPTRGVRAVDCASTVMEDVREDLRLAATPAETADILVPAMAFDSGDVGGNPAGHAVQSRQAALVEGCDILGHTMTPVLAATGDLVNFDGVTPNWNYAKAALLRARPAPPGRYALLPDVSNYYHFLGNDVLPLVNWLERRPGDAPLTIVTRREINPMARHVIDALARAYPVLRVMEIGALERLTGVTLEWVFALATNYEWMPVTRGDADRLAAILAAHDAAGGLAPAAPGERLYLDRGNAKLRRMTDAEAVDRVLERHGFARFVARYDNHAEQVAAFAGARIVVATHGAGLANLLFCRPGATVVEIFPSNFVKSTYFWLSRRLGLNYRYVIGGPGDYDQHFAAGADALDRVLAEVTVAGSDR
ncbi:glycosyltransferase family 61 protein [Alsobacter sp. SYSU M60028]|uniref:Glycosyltransferase family 61 protein n=1 Tax=Alsobacter ponti TaxID=2962936 RepID=A0ABT1LGA6_9HYPH|nr:glycosyltransferase family 61 protein [Alsobacter ponti]MCP8940106.1 glycosyltransferase family 61 protein [Alsobacter ponti]